MTGAVFQWDLQKKIHYFDLTAVSFARWLRKSPANKIATLSRRLGLARESGGRPANSSWEASEGIEILTHLDYAVYFLAYRLYRPKTLAVPATLYFPEETPPARLSWVKRASERASAKVTIEILPGDHHTCITKYIAALVEKMKRTLDDL